MYIHTIYICISFSTHENIQIGLFFLQSSGCKNSKIRFVFPHPHTAAQILFDIQIYIYTYTSVLYECWKFMRILRFRVSDLLPNIRDLFCGCQTVQTSLWMRQKSLWMRQYIPRTS